MMSWSPAPPRTRQAQLDEKWGLVAKKEANCDPADKADARKGDHRDHVALDLDHRLVLSVVNGKRTAENTVALVRDFRRRTSGRLMDPIDLPPEPDPGVMRVRGRGSARRRQG